MVCDPQAEWEHSIMRDRVADAVRRQLH
jgi:hypothetical protein